MHVRSSHRLLYATVPVQPLPWLPLAWLLLVALAFGINSASLGIKAASGPGFFSQIEHLIFAGNSDNGRFSTRSEDIKPSGDGDPAHQWLAITPCTTPVVLLPQATCYSTAPALIFSYRANYYQQAPRAPPFA